MTNEQLAVILHGIQNNLEFEIYKIREKLPEECFGVSVDLFGFPVCNVPILDGISDLSVQLGNKISILTGG